MGAKPSVGTVGDSYDNALAESVNGLYKTELVYRRGPWRTFEELELATLEWVDWYNNRRIHSGCGNMSPAQYERSYYAHQSAMVPDRSQRS
ncbi:transposase [Frankia sp. Hr75.2]|nr:transposase [Frankia sp. Hr75.2]